MNLLNSGNGRSHGRAEEAVRDLLQFGRDLEQQMELATPETKKNLAMGFETFLNQVRGTAKGTQRPVLGRLHLLQSWGKAMGRPKQSDCRPEAKQYYGEAAKSYQDILDRAKSGKLQLEGQLQGQIGLQLAKTRRAMGEYDAAIKLFMETLAKSPALLTVQMEAAKTYEEWADRSGDSKYYLNASRGAWRTGRKKSTIWGWAEIAKITSGKPQFRDTFYEARYHVALARYKYAMNPKNAAEKKKHLDAADQALGKTIQLYPNLDGNAAENQKEFRTQYDTLAKMMQKALGKPEKGLAAYESATPPAAPATPAATAKK